MYGNIPNSGLTISKVFSGISKSLNVVNQLIPIYREVKPVIGNAKNILGVLKDFNNSTQLKEKSTAIISEKKDTSKVESISNNNPIFFV